MHTSLFSSCSTTLPFLFLSLSLSTGLATCLRWKSNPTTFRASLARSWMARTGVDRVDREHRSAVPSVQRAVTPRMAHGVCWSSMSIDLLRLSRSYQVVFFPWSGVFCWIRADRDRLGRRIWQ
ncbi:hypothetical protein I7I53_11011 [Histoplasma capsulatum var. duboisii H88]|uniref:Secreted protein n=1 Tax=Ajellomyces capsulatus (strain H88) TaxID=544711 RepID=A0A8A1LCF8_AJEC8|nr:hypothetical protein I7I53_11011 [Histoplasma capsulatum var. duboisii H88]